MYSSLRKHVLWLLYLVQGYCTLYTVQYDIIDMEYSTPCGATTDYWYICIVVFEYYCPPTRTSSGTQYLNLCLLSYIVVLRSTNTHAHISAKASKPNEQEAYAYAQD